MALVRASGRAVSVALWVGLGCAPSRSVQRAEKPISDPAKRYEFPGFSVLPPQGARWFVSPAGPVEPLPEANLLLTPQRDRKSTRLNSSHSSISYAVFCL